MKCNRILNGLSIFMQNTFYHNQRKNNGAIKKFTIDLQKFTTANESIPWHIETDIILKYNLSLICNFYILKNAVSCWMSGQYLPKIERSPPFISVLLWNNMAARKCSWHMSYDKCHFLVLIM